MEKKNLRHFGILRSVVWELVTDVSVETIFTIFWDQVVEGGGPLEP